MSEENLRKPKTKGYRIFVFITAVLLPLAGLTLNGGFGPFGWGGGGIFGDFGSPWFFIIAAANGLVMLADIKDNKRSLALFYLKCAGFTYIAYFTIIFIPWLPVGFIGIIYFGLGLLIFVPVTVFITEIVQILKDIRRLKLKFEKSVIAVMILGLITIPVILAINFQIDKVNFDNAMAYVEAKNSMEARTMPTINIKRLNRTMAYMDRALDTRRRSDFLDINDENIPIISTYYQNVILENKILAPDTMQRVSIIFFGAENEQPLNTGERQFPDVNLISAATNTEYDAEAGVYKTWVDLEIENLSDRSLAEYQTEFFLPDGCFIKDYYLEVGNERKQGILTDKRAALIIYNNILRTPKDPGIIYYQGDNKIELRVYPFSKNEVRKTGFQVWHSQQEVINIDGTDIYLDAQTPVREPLDMPGVSFIPASYKENLPPINRKPKYYFIIDASEKSPLDEHYLKVSDYVEKHKITDVEFYAASYKAYDKIADTVKQEGGFNLPLAIEMVFNDVEQGYYPVVIAVSDNLNRAPEFQKNNLAKRFPESAYYYNLGYDLSLTPYSFADNKKHDAVKVPILTEALDYNGFAVADNNKSETIIAGDFNGYTDNEYHNAFILQGKCSDYNNDDSMQIDLIRQSFRQRLLTKYTAFIVLETKQQENDLLDLQAKFMNEGNNAVPAVMMAEPGLLMCILMAAVLVIGGRRRAAGAKQ